MITYTVTVKDIFAPLAPVFSTIFSIFGIIFAVLLVIYLTMRILAKRGKEAPKILVTIIEIINNLIPEQNESGYADAYQAKSKEPDPQNDYKGHYQAKYLLTRNEWYEYKKLKQYAAIHDLQICPKVRLLDIVEPRRGDPNYMSYIGKIKSKHVDFVICDQDLHIKGIVELDDNSHDRTDRKERDAFVDGVLTDVGYKVIHTRSVTETTLEPITAPNTEH